MPTIGSPARLAAIFCAVWVAAARGEDPAAAPPSEATAAEATRGRVIEEIIVTAQKREENVREVPISMAVLNDEFLAERNVTDFKDVASAVPNVAIDNEGEFNDVRMRGFGSPLSNKAFEQSVGLVIEIGRASCRERV